MRPEPTWGGRGPQRNLVSLRIERYGECGERLDPVQVTLRTGRLRGRIASGAEVTAHGRWTASGLRAVRIENRTSRSTIRGSAPWRRVPLWTGLLVVTALLLAQFVPGWLDTASKPVASAVQVTVPDLAGTTEAQAMSQLTAAGLMPQRFESPADGKAPGTVLRTDPPAGTLLAKGGPITVFVAGGTQGVPALPTPSALPGTSGSTSGSTSGTSGNQSQDPGHKATAGSTGTGGATAGTGTTAGSAAGGSAGQNGAAKPEIPGELAGLTRDDALRMRQGLDLKADFRYTTEVDDGIVDHAVTRTSPGMGTKVPKGATVTVLLAAPTVPAVQGLSLYEARRQVFAAGFDNVVVQGSDDPNAPVKEVTPAAGRRAMPGSPITLVVLRNTPTPGLPGGAED
ncbi:PASTA domain-containing protein [Streptomyces sp. NPDC056773]|uniref:PASTA domain-containing protein n=1 Tax=unclassified Streptomyces TaxID=2593676 RepID=UPI0036B78604